MFWQGFWLGMGTSRLIGLHPGLAEKVRSKTKEHCRDSVECVNAKHL